jgi:DNA (cytosine-5)-methyltransferase 1
VKHIGLFEGIGGFSLAARWMGWETAAWCEWNEFGQRVLKHHFPQAEGFGDITKTDFTKYANRIDILTGGFPCQPYSLAGNRKGKADDRHLWPEMLRAIREIQPTWVVGENVFGLINWDGGLVFDEVQTDLEAAGYEVWPYVLPACAVNAPHRRDRVWFVAYSKSKRSCRLRIGKEQAFTEHGIISHNGTTPHAISSSERPSRKSSGTIENGSGNYKQPKEWRGEAKQHIRCSDVSGDITHPDSNGQHQSNSKHEVNASKRGINARRNIKQIYAEQPISQHPNCIRQERRMHPDKPETTIRKQFSERDARSAKPTSWQNFPTQPPICGGDDGLPSELDGITFSKWRNESIKAYGNAIVPQVAFQIFKAIEELTHTEPH